jgi:hypothetical protein
VGGCLFAHRGKPGRYSGSSAVLEAPGLVPGFDDFAVMGQSIEQRRRHLGVAEHDTTPQDRNGCQPACGSSMRPTRFTVSGLRSAQARRVGGSAGSGSFFPTAGTAGSRGRPLISTMRLVRPGRIVICRRYRYAPCFPWRNTCEQGFPLRERRSMEHRARQLTLPFGPALPNHSLILAPRVWADDDAESAAAAGARIGAAAPDSSRRS